MIEKTLLILQSSNLYWGYEVKLDLCSEHFKKNKYFFSTEMLSDAQRTQPASRPVAKDSSLYLPCVGGSFKALKTSNFLKAVSEVGPPYSWTLEKMGLSLRSCLSQLKVIEIGKKLLMQRLEKGSFCCQNSKQCSFVTLRIYLHFI